MAEIHSVGKIIGANVAKWRTKRGMSQRELGEVIAPLNSGQVWPRQTVSAIEKGDRAFAVGEVVGLASVLDCTVMDLLRPPATEKLISVGSGWVAPKVLTGEPERLDVGRLLLHVQDAERSLRAALAES